GQDRRLEPEEQDGLDARRDCGRASAGPQLQAFPGDRRRPASRDDRGRRDASEADTSPRPEVRLRRQDEITWAVARWARGCGFTNVVLEIANEFGHGGFDHRLLKTPAGQAELIGLAKKTHPGLLVSTSGLGDGTVPGEVARAADFLLIHLNGTKIEDIPARVKALKEYGKPVVCNEDAKVGEA